MKIKILYTLWDKIVAMNLAKILVKLKTEIVLSLISGQSKSADRVVSSGSLTFLSLFGLDELGPHVGAHNV